MMGGPDELGDFLCSSEVWAAFQPDGKAVHVGPPRLRSAVVVHPLLGVSHGQGRNHRGVKATRDEQPVGHIAHQM